MSIHPDILKPKKTEYHTKYLPTDINIYDISKEHKHILFLQSDKIFNVTFTNETVQMSGKWVLINSILLRPYIKRRLPIDCSIDVIHNQVLDKHIQNQLTRMYEVIFELEGMDDVVFEFKRVFDDLMELIVTKLSPYEISLDVFKIDETLQMPELQELLNTDFSQFKGLKEKETELKRINKRCMDIILDPQYLQDNKLYEFAKLKTFSAAQLPQAIMMVGNRADVDNVVIPHMIETSYFKGLRNIADYVVDSASAKVAIFANKTGMASSSYSNRKQQLLAHGVQTIYHKDCGSEVTVPFYIHDKYKNNVIGVNIKYEGRVQELTKDNIDNFTNKIVHMYLPNTCRYTDGVCTKCGGELLRKYSHKNLTIGPSSVTISISPIIQEVLSYKHSISTTIIMFKLNNVLSEYFYVVDNNIVLREGHNPDDLLLGINYSEGMRLSDLQVSTTHNLEVEQFTQITHIHLYNKKTKQYIFKNVKLQDRHEVNKTDVYLTSEVLHDIKKDRKNTISYTDDVIWLNLENIETKEYLVCPSVSDHVLEFVKRVESVQSSAAIRDQHSLTNILRDFTNLLWEKEKPNLIHIAIILKSSMVTSLNNTQIPIVVNVENVSFNSLKNILQQRTIASALAYEQFWKVAAHPASFYCGKGENAFDHFVLSGITRTNK